MSLADWLVVGGSAAIILGMAMDAQGVGWAEIVCVLGGTLAILVALAMTFFRKKDGTAF